MALQGLSLGGDYLLWRGDMQKFYKETTWNNAIAGFPQHNLNMLTAKGQYAGFTAQTAYDPAVYAQIAAVATKV